MAVYWKNDRLGKYKVTILQNTHTDRWQLDIGIRTSNGEYKSIS